MSPATQNTNKSYWGTGSNNAIQSTSAVSFIKDKFPLFQEAAMMGRDLIKSHHGKRNGVDDDITAIEKLAELRDRGILTKEEFETKKKALLGI